MKEKEEAYREFYRKEIYDDSLQVIKRFLENFSNYKKSLLFQKAIKYIKKDNVWRTYVTDADLQELLLDKMRDYQTRRWGMVYSKPNFLGKLYSRREIIEMTKVKRCQ